MGLVASLIANALAWWALSEAENRAQSADDKATYQFAKWGVVALAIFAFLAGPYSRNSAAIPRS